MRLLKKIYNCLWVLVHVKFWLMNYPYEEEWDNFLRKSISDGHSFTDISSHTAKLNGAEIWIENYPYAAFTLYSGPKYRPARKTIYELRKKLIQDTIKEISKKEYKQKCQ